MPSQVEAQVLINLIQISLVQNTDQSSSSMMSKVVILNIKNFEYLDVISGFVFHRI